MTSPPQDTGHKEVTAAGTAIDRDAAAVARWCEPYLSRALAAGPLPLVGCPSWCALPDADPRKLAAVLRAGMAWCSDCTRAAVARSLAHEIAVIDLEIAERMKAMASDLSAATDWAAASRRPSHAELTRRRAVIA